MTRLFTALVMLLTLVVGGCAHPVDQTGPVSPGPKVSTTAQTATAKPSGRVQQTDPASGLRWIDETSLPAEARATLRLIDAGGPFPYDKDGAVFGNRERRLPLQKSGYYREYTVKTPGSRDRGARRIVTGQQSEYYWTADHYRSFERIRR